MRITNIEIKNYRAFYGKHPIDLGKEGANLMIYGENGSGKSSLYHALKDFFSSSLNEKSENIFVPDNQKGTVSICLEMRSNADKTKTVSFTLDNQNRELTDPLIVDANKVKAFFDYRSILETHLNHTDSVNIFNILVKNVLPHVIGRLDKRTIGRLWEDIDHEINNVKQAASHVVPRIKGNIDSFNQEFGKVLEDIQENTNNFLKKFDENLQIKIVFQGLIYHGRRNLQGAEAFLKVRLLEKDIPQHQFFLNEARLSALAISLYLSSILRNPPAELKVLMLDDLLIGLDMGNRLPLLNILKEHFNDWQIFMTTYDRQWFEICKRWFELNGNNKWKCIEIYANDYDYSFEVPTILESKSNLAQAHYYTRQFDYPAAANYLRKAVEETLKECFHSLLHKNNDGTEIEKLSTKIRHLTLFLKSIGENRDPLEQIELHIQSLMNPLSHHDLDVNVFKQELRKVMEAIKQLKERDYTKAKLLCAKGEKLRMKLAKTNTITNIYELEALDNLWVCKIGEEKKVSNILFNSFECWVITNDIEEKRGKFKHYKSKSLQDIYEGILEHEKDIAKYSNIYDLIFISGQASLQSQIDNFNQ